MHRAARPALLLALALALVLGAVEAGAVMPHERLADPALEARAREISRDLRCQVCQNQSIDDSNAPLAADLRRLVRERLVAGDSDAAVLRHVTDRYGDFVRLTPPLRADTALLWATPLLVLLAAIAGLGWRLRRRAAPVAAPLSPAEQAAFARLLAAEDRADGTRPPEGRR
jgi:cytochrome c-type biogenesis protein CcmH